MSTLDTSAILQVVHKDYHKSFVSSEFVLKYSNLKNPSVRQETWVQSLGWEAPLEKGLAAHSSILAGKTQWAEEPIGLQSMELLKSQT